MNTTLYVPWHRRRERWRHDHNTNDGPGWRAVNLARVDKMMRVSEGRFEGRCPCGTLFVADASKPNVIYPPVKAIGIG